MKVEAIAQGFYKGRRYREGAQFDVPSGTTGKWFVPAAAIEKPKAETLTVPVKGGKKPEKDAAPLA